MRTSTVGPPATTTDPRSAGRRGWLTLALWLGSLLAGTALFHVVGRDALAPPPLTEPGAWGAWAAGRDPLVATVAILRLLVLALSWYLVGATTIGILARLTRAARLVRIADALTVPALRRLLQGALGLSLATAMVGASLSGGARPVDGSGGGDRAVAGAELQLTRLDGGRDELRLRQVQAPAGGPARGPAPAGDEVRLQRAAPVTELRLTRSDPLPLELLDRAGPDAPAGDTADTPGSDTDTPADGGAAVDGAPAAGDVTPADATGDRAAVHTVTPGESFWSVAAATLADAWGRPPSDAEVHGYWQDLIDANRHQLVEPGNPDLLLPGQQLTLPPTPAVPS